MKTMRIAALLLLLVSLMTVAVHGEDNMAEDISSPDIVTANEFIPVQTALFDMELQTPSSYINGASLQLEHEAGIGSLYIIFDREYGTVELTDNDTQTVIEYDTKGVVHCFVDVEKLFGNAPKSLKVKFTGGDLKLNELRVFTPGQTPDWVQRWQEPLEGEADLVLFSTHADDEQLFFAGILPYYAGELGYKVQVVYFTNHRNLNNYRVHEALNGLWAVGVRNYPALGTFPDYFTDTLQNAYDLYRNQGYDPQKLQSFVVEQLRRFKPYVAIGHDIMNGEYKHGVHMLYADTLVQCLDAAADASQFPESAEKYGVWEVPKTYLHLYPDNPIVMDWDQPLSRFDGKTAFQVTKDLGFPCHASQTVGFAWFYDGTVNAVDVKQYSPCEFGLYRSLVGDDVNKNDFFENIDRQQSRLEKPEEVAEETEPVTEAPTEPEPVPTETEAMVEATEPAVQAMAPSQKARKEGRWLIVPAVGAAVLVAAAAIVSAKSKKHRFEE